MTLSHSASTRVTLVSLLAAALLFGLLPLAGSQQSRAAPTVHFADGRTSIHTLPYTITTCGSYVVVDCLTGTAGQGGIIVQASDVTVDLNGFALTGVPGSLSGIVVGAGITNVRVRDGSLSRWGESGLDAAAGTGIVLERVHASACGKHGFDVGDEASLRACTATGNALRGIRAGADATIDDCASTKNGTLGISAGPGALLAACRASENGATGFRVEGRVSESVSRENGGFGFYVEHGAVVGCTAIRDRKGGVQAATQSLVQDCSISTPDNPLVTARAIEVGDHCRTLWNRCGVQDTDYGVLVTGDWNQIEHNAVTNHLVGIKVDGANNWLVGNTVGGDPLTAFDMGTGNSYGNIRWAGTGQANADATENVSYIN